MLEKETVYSEVQLNKELAHRLFRIAVFIKGLDGTLELLGGIALFFISPGGITHFAEHLFAHELLEDPADPLANYLIKASLHLTPGTQIFAAIYLLVHGIIKVGLVSALWYNKRWAYPLAGIVLSIFVVYQIARMLSTHSLILLLLTAIDLIIILLLRIEYKRLIVLHK